MFQDNHNDPKDKQVAYNLDAMNPDDLAKITLSFKSTQTNQGENEFTLLKSVKKMMDLNREDATTPLLCEIDALKETYQIETNIDKTRPLIDVHEVSEPIEFDQIIQSSEKALFSATNQKDLLKSLIDDINSSSNTNINYDDTLFMENINRIVAEDDEEVVPVSQPVSLNRVIKEQTPEPIEDIKGQEKSRLISNLLIVLLVIMVIFGVSYLYKDLIIELFEANLLEIDGVYHGKH
jgi:hypothetical protein